ncbi:MAG: hypothetical protein ACXVWU_07565 [Nocardioides sp.]
MEDASELLMTTGTLTRCPDCDAERLFVVVAEDEHCCTGCDAAVFGLDTRPAPRRARTGVARLSRRSA